MQCLPGGISGLLGALRRILQMRQAVKAAQSVCPIQPVHLASTVYASGVERWMAQVYVLTHGRALVTSGSMMRKMDARQLAVPNTAEKPPPTQYHISGSKKRSPTAGGRTTIRHTAGTRGTCQNPALAFTAQDLILRCLSLDTVLMHHCAMGLNLST